MFFSCFVANCFEQIFNKNMEQGNKGRSRRLSDAKAIHTCPLAATSRLAPSTPTPSRSCQGWCEWACQRQSAQKSSPTAHMSPGDLLIGTSSISNSDLFSVLLLFDVGLVSVLVCVCACVCTCVCVCVCVRAALGCTWPTWSQRCTTRYVSSWLLTL